MGIPNDQRGWILASLSGVACALGACLINLDIVLHVVPRWRTFEIRESTIFLAASLSLSFGVMFFSALFSLLPEAKQYFLKHGYPPDKAGCAVIGFFLVGVLGLQIVSELLHRCLPSSIVSCEDHAGVDLQHRHHDTGLEGGIPPFAKPPAPPHAEDENTPLLERRPPIKYARTFLAKNCASGKCYGYSDHPCDQFCSVERSKKAALDLVSSGIDVHSFHGTDDHEDSTHNDAQDSSHCHDDDQISVEAQPELVGEAGHHHVPKNKFLTIGIQTSIAIALHKFPEGFITFATNHANPILGFNVFIALFIHNIAEGFAMCLPLFLALQSRTKAVIWASLLGGLAQPAGALLAWLSVRGRESPLQHAAYGVLFSITAGIMCSVGLQLFSQAVSLHHGSRLCFIFAFVGMAVMGFSSAITAH
ncbi:Zinc/iron permease [Sphaerosporella brunnea]|uniref:Zinc/iron permease n=1 Tax=Sphaerosporella brunnea TaxID=1250544 RepID=A0A5J5F0D4_9PEZI|nr:Zinc/iron permease [Sphaerosporella brunnea]